MPYPIIIRFKMPRCAYCTTNYTVIAKAETFKEDLRCHYIILITILRLLLVARSLPAPFLIVFHVFFWHVRRRNNHNHQPHPHWHHPCHHHANYHHHHPVWPQLPIIILIFIILSTKKTHHNLITEVRLASNSIAGTSVIWPMWLLQRRYAIHPLPLLN